MIDHDRLVGALLDKLDELGLTDDTIVLYSTDNGPHANSWPDAATTPFRSEKNTNWEGAFRVPQLIRWPGRVEAGSVSTELISHMDWLPTLVAAGGDPGVKEKLLQGHEAAGKTFRVHLDGFDFLPSLTGQREKGPRASFFYFSDDGDLVAMRYDNWKLVFMEQRLAGTLQVWFEPFVPLRVPKLYNLRTDPFERADVTSNTYWDWFMDHVFLVVPAQDIVGEFLHTFVDFPPRQRAASFTIDRVLETLASAMTGGR
jgi:arylsulfatase